MSLVEELLPVFDVSDTVAVVVEAGVAATWGALMQVDLVEVGRRRPIVAVLGALRIMPEVVSHLVHGEALPGAPERLRLIDTTEIPMGEGGWVMLGIRPNREIALGLVGKFWRPVISYAQVTTDQFRTFSDPGYAKTVYALAVKELETNRTLLSGTMRTATTDEKARRWFRRYWTLGVGSGAHVLVQGLVDLTKEVAESERESA
jgi:hypothetical protein